jgi:predicted GNAT family acetyltransferase
MKKTYLSILCVCITVLVWAQQDTITPQDEQLINEKLSITQEMDKRVIDLQNNILDNREKILENQSEIHDLFITNIGAQEVLWAILGGFLSLLGGSTYVKQYYRKKINKDVTALQKQHTDAIDEIKVAKNEMIQRIHNMEMENKTLREQSQILIIGETSTGRNNTLESIFVEGSAKVKFNHTYVKIPNLNIRQLEEALLQEEIQDIEDFQLVIIDNCRAANRQWEGRNHDKRLFIFTEAILKRKTAVLYFSDDLYFPTNDDYEALENKHFLGFANAHPRVYTNAMELLKVESLFG